MLSFGFNHCVRGFYSLKSLGPLRLLKLSPLEINIFRGVHKKPVIMKLETPEFKSIFTDELVTLLDLFGKHNYEIRIAGGAVRDLILGKTPKDVDFATTATPDQMKEMFNSEEVRMINEKGEKHGTITARINNENFEITTLRIDVTTDGRHAEVQFTTDWELDANRRDLTINSMFLDRNGTIYDYFNGYEDLKKRRVVFVGNASKRIQEDYLRILRYFRFYARIAEKPDDHDEDTIRAISDNVNGLDRITGERIWLELSKILSGNYVSSIVQRLIQVGCGPYIGFPTKPNVGELISIWERAKHLNLHSMTVLASLMNTEEELMAFHARCKLSTFERDLGLFIIQHRNKQTEHPLKPYQALMLKTDGKLNDIKLYILELFKYKADLNLIHEFQSWEPPKFPINGKILKDYGVPPGKTLGRVLKELKMFWVTEDFQPDEKQLTDMIPEILKKGKAV